MAKKEWTAESVSEHKVSNSVMWRAQVSTSPTGVTFIGVRKFKVDADGNETPDRQGITLKLPENEAAREALAEELRSVGTLLATCADSLEGAPTAKAKRSAPAKKVAAKKVAAKKPAPWEDEAEEISEEAEKIFVLKRKGEDEDSKYVKKVVEGKVIVTQDVSYARQFGTRVLAKKALTALGTNASRFEIVPA